MIYSLQSLDNDKILTGELNVTDTSALMFVTASKNAVGVVVLDKNTDLANTRTFINLQNRRTTKQKFFEVVDTEFKEFTKPVADPAMFLKAKISALQNQIQKLQSQIGQDDVQINSLKKQIQNLTNLLSGGNNPSGLQEYISNVVNNTATVGTLQGNVTNNATVSGIGTNIGQVNTAGSFGTNNSTTNTGTSNTSTDIDPVIKYIFTTDISNNANQFTIYVNGTPKLYITKSNLSGSFTAKDKDAISVKSSTNVRHNTTIEMYDDSTNILVKDITKSGNATLPGTDVLANRVYRLNGSIELAE